MSDQDQQDNRESKLQAEIDTYKKEQEIQNTASDSPIQQTEPERYAPKDEWEEKALKIGWNPEHSGDNFVPAREYVLRKPLFERIERQSTELRALKERDRQIAINQAQMRKEAYDQALKDLEYRTKEAVKDANIDEFDQLNAQTKQLNAQMSRDPIFNIPEPEKEPVHPDIDNFQKQEWFNENTPENSKMKAFAEAADAYLAKQAHIDGRQIDVKHHLAAVNNAVQKEFSHRFGVQQQVTQIPQNTSVQTQAVAKSTASVRNIGSNTNIVAMLTPQQRELGERFGKSNPEYTLEVYANELQSMGRLGK